MARAIRIHATGGPEQLRLAEVAVPPVGRGEVLLRQTAVGVNALDLQQRRGEGAKVELPAGIGCEAVGTVLAIGPGVGLGALRVGDRVGYALSQPGAYAEQRVVAASALVRLPAGLGDPEAAAVLRKGLVAEFLVRRAFRIGPGHRALVHGAAGGVGLLLCQWLRHLGALVAGTVGSHPKAEVAAAHGCHHPIVRGEEDFVAAVLRLTQGRGVDVVYDAVGHETLPGSLRCLRPRGVLVAFGSSSGPPPPLDPLELERHGSLFLTRPSLQHYLGSRPELERAAAALFTVLAQGALRPRLQAELPLAAAAEAHRQLEARQVAGAIVLRP